MKTHCRSIHGVRFPVACIVLSALVGLTGPAYGQKSDTPAQAVPVEIPAALSKMIAARKDALAAIKADDTNAAMTAVAAMIAAQPDDAPRELQLARKWGELSAALRNQNDYKRAASTAAYAITQITDHPKAFNQLQGVEGARLVAELYEYVLGDTTMAMKYYEQAAGSDKVAAAGLARMKAVQAMLATKAEEAELLRQREAVQSTN